MTKSAEIQRRVNEYEFNIGEHKFRIDAARNQIKDLEKQIEDDLRRLSTEETWLARELEALRKALADERLAAAADAARQAEARKFLHATEPRCRSSFSKQVYSPHCKRCSKIQVYIALMAKARQTDFPGEADSALAKANEIKQIWGFLPGEIVDTRYVKWEAPPPPPPPPPPEPPKPTPVYHTSPRSSSRVGTNPTTRKRPKPNEVI